MEIAKLLQGKSDTLRMLDLNGNRFGEEGKLEMAKMLENVQSALCTMSEDEGSDDDGENGDDDDNYDDDDDDEQEAVSDEGEEEEEDEHTNQDDIEVIGEEDYDQADDDYEEEYDDDDDEYDGEEEGEEGEEGDETPQRPPLTKQQESLFTQFKFGAATNGAAAGAAPSFLPSGNKGPAVNLFSNMVRNSALMTNTVKAFDQFVLNPNEETLKAVCDNEQAVGELIDSPKFSGAFLVRCTQLLSTLYRTKLSTGESCDTAVLAFAKRIVSAYLLKIGNDAGLFADDFLVEIGMLKVLQLQLQLFLFF